MQKKPKFVDFDDDIATESIEAPKPQSHFIDSIFKGQREKQRADEEKEIERSRKRERTIVDDGGAEAESGRRAKAARSPDLGVEVVPLADSRENEMSESDGMTLDSLNFNLFSILVPATQTEDNNIMKVDSSRSGGIILKVPNLQGENQSNRNRELEVDMVW
jgi:hypothetical protein